TPTERSRWTPPPKLVTLPTTSTVLTATATSRGFEYDGAFPESIRYDWTSVSAPPGVSVAIQGIGFGAEKTLVERLTVPGVYVFRLAATGATGSPPGPREFTMRVYDGNQAPFISKGARYYHQEWLIAPASTQT